MNKTQTAKIEALSKKHPLQLRQKRLLQALPKAKNYREAGLMAGYKDSKYLPQIVSQAIHHTNLKHYVDSLGILGLQTLEDVATNGKNEIARVNAGSKLIETAYGKPKEQVQETGNITIVINKI